MKNARREVMKRQRMLVKYNLKEMKRYNELLKQKDFIESQPDSNQKESDLAKLKSELLDVQMSMEQIKGTSYYLYITALKKSPKLSEIAKEKGFSTNQEYAESLEEKYRTSIIKVTSKQIEDYMEMNPSNKDNKVVEEIEKSISF